MATHIDINEPLNSDDFTNSQYSKSQQNFNEDVDDNIFNIIPTVTIRGLHREESLKDLVEKKQLLRGYEPTNRILNKMETRILRFNPNLNNSHTLDDIYAGKHSLQKDDLEYLKPINVPKEKLEDSNDTLTTIANFLYPIKKCNDTLVINSNIDSSKQLHESPLSELSIDTSLALEIEHTINQQHIPLKSSGPINKEEENIQITPEGIVYSNEILLSERQRTIKTLIDKKKDTNNVQLDVPKYYKEVSRYKQNNAVDSNGQPQVSIRNVNNMYSYSQNVYLNDASLHNPENSNKRVSWFGYAFNVFIQFWVDLWEDIKNLF